MQSFKQYISEETMPYAATARGSINIDDPSVLDGLNTTLTGVTSDKFVTPYIAFERVQKALANFLIFPSRPTFLEGESGLYTNPIKQFGEKMGQTNDGNFVEDDQDKYHLYFEYMQDDDGMFKVFCEIVTEDELDDLLDDVEDEVNSSETDDLDEDTQTIDETSVRAAKKYLNRSMSDAMFWNRETSEGSEKDKAKARRKLRSRAEGQRRAEKILKKKEAAE
jgi:hypothetical protein